MLTNRLPTIVADFDDKIGEYLVTVMWPGGKTKTDWYTANCGEDAIEKMARVENIDDYAFRVR